MLKAHWILAKETGEIAYSSGTHIDSPLVFTELTLPQLRDLVVLKRNDINDANWETEGSDQIFKDSNNKSYIYRSDGWDELQRHEMRQAMWEKPKAIGKPKDQGLISGAEALRALADGLSVEMTDAELGMDWTEICIKDGDFIGKVEPCLWMFLNQPEHIQFRLKPQTIKLELEIPKPFEPKHGEMYWWIDATSEEGYSYTYFDNNKADHDIMQFGAWRTEEEIKQVVEQLRKLRGNNS
nr:hypothetical protein [Acinetobacter baumannii]